MKCQLTPEEEEQLCNDFIAAMPHRKLAKKYDITIYRVRQILLARLGTSDLTHGIPQTDMLWR